MTRNTLIEVNAKGKRISKPKGKKYGVQNFSDFAPQNDHKRFDEMIDQTIYIIKLEPLASDEYGSGFKVWFKDLPNARDTYTAGCFGQYIVPQLENVFNLTNKGTRISLDSPIKTTIRKAGRTYRFE